MNPPYPTQASAPEAVPLQGRRFDGFPDQPVGPTVVQYTSVNMPAEPPKDHIVWSLFTMLYCGNPFCLGLAAFIFSIKARDRKLVGDHNGARKYGSTAHCLNIVAAVLTFITAIIFLIFVYNVVKEWKSSLENNYNNYKHNSFEK